MTRSIPAEWSLHRAIWVGWPSHGELWEESLEPAQAEVEALVRALAGPGRETVKLMVGKPEALDDARTRFAGVAHVEVIDGRFGDIWLRDTGPIFGAGSATAAAFRFNGWGGKYELEYDDTVAEQIGAASGVALDRHDFILEGGALDHDGQGTIVTTRQCRLHPNHNPRAARGCRRGRAGCVAGRAQGPVARRRPAERPHRRPCRQSGPVRRAGRDRLSDRIRPK